MCSSINRVVRAYYELKPAALKKKAFPIFHKPLIHFKAFLLSLCCVITAVRNRGLQKLCRLSFHLTFIWVSADYLFLVFKVIFLLPASPENLLLLLSCFPRMVGFKWESAHCSTAIFVALSQLVELLLVFLPLSMAYLLSSWQAVLCNRNFSPLLPAEHRLLRVLPGWVLSISKDRVFTASLSNLCQCFSVKVLVCEPC